MVVLKSIYCPLRNRLACMLACCQHSHCRNITFSHISTVSCSQFCPPANRILYSRMLSEAATLSTVKVLTSRIVSVDPQSGWLKEPFDQDRTIEISRRSGRILRVRLTTDSDLELLHPTTTQGPEVQSDDVIDLRGKTVLPGFIDTHVHCKFMLYYVHMLYDLTTYDVVLVSLLTSLCRHKLGGPGHAREYRGKNHSSCCTCTGHSLSRIHDREVGAASQ